jgi:protein-S-isoprenylcysteine O-methyltransferase Ste14
MPATLFEFRHRWWVIFGIFTLAFWAYGIDPKNSGVAIANWTAARFGTAANQNWYRLAFAAGSLLCFIAAMLRTWGTSYLRADVMRDSRVHTERLLADGPYRYVRNPLYIGNILLAVGAGLMASRIGFVILVVGMIVFILRLISREETELARDQGEAYRRYCAAVPRILPALTPRVPSAGNIPHWGQALRVEAAYWLFAVAIGAFAATLNRWIFWAIFACGVAATVLSKSSMRRSPAASTQPK